LHEIIADCIVVQSKDWQICLHTKYSCADGLSH